ncbi:MAG: GAF domain-containing protein [Elusimicrobia bacterium]|nr:GAF domain-containing protein [Elusimicrobiota bacterium]
MAVIVVDEKLGIERKKVLETALKILEKLISADGCSFMFRDEENDEIEIVAASEQSEEVAKRKIGIRIKVGERVAGRTVSEKKPFLIVGDISQNKDFAHLKKYEEISSGLSAPAVKDGKVVGVLNAKKLTSREILSQQDLEIAQNIAAVIAELL